MAGQIFFSYTRKDHEFVDQLVDDLEARGVDVWIDRGDIIAGETGWRQQIVEAIKSCSVFFIVLSPNSSASNNVYRELTLAERHNKTIIPIFYQITEIPDSMADQLAGLQELYFYLGEYDENFQDLLRALKNLGFTIQEPSDDADLPSTRRKPAQPQSFWSKIPLWGWITGAAVLLSALGIGGYSILGGGTPEPTSTSPPTLPVAVANAPTETEMPPTETDIPTDTPKPTETPLDEPEDTPVPDTPTPTEIPSPTPLPQLWTDEFGVEMVLIPAGTFLMGSNSHEDNSYPAHTKETGEYYIDKYEVTNNSYQKCVQAGACQLPRSSGSKTRANYYESSDYNFYPVIWVSWDDAVSYCEWRGGRLPTEAEWEKAARSDDARTYPWGDEVGTECVEANYWEYNGCGDTRAIGSTLGESPYGVFEMAGNVWEWVQDDYIAYPGGRAGAIASSDIGNKVIRGGSWTERDETIKTTYRGSARPKTDANDIGFRCVVDVPLP
jgi:formylglycine-generating enzyme required for sulfatase activity